MNVKKKIIALVSATAVAMASLAGTVGASAVFSDGNVQEEATQILNAASTYTISPGTKIVYSELPAADKMIGWNWSEFGIGANEKVQKVEAEVVGAPKPEVVKTPVDTRVILTGSLLYLVFIPIILEIIL